MAWTSPMTAVANAAFTAAQFNTHVRDNLNETAPAKATMAGRYFATTGANSIAERELAEDFVSANESTASTSFTDLATPGPSVTVTTSTTAMVMVSCQMSNNTSLGRAAMSYAVSGATTIPADPVKSFLHEGASNSEVQASLVHWVNTLTPGSNVFTAKYAVDGGTGLFQRRRLIIMPF